MPSDWSKTPSLNPVTQGQIKTKFLTCITFAKTLRPFSVSASTFAITSSSTHCLQTKRGFARRAAFSRRVCQSASESSPSHMFFSLSIRAAYFSSQLRHCFEAASHSSTPVLADVNFMRPSMKVSKDDISAGRKLVRCRKLRWKSSFCSASIASRGCTRIASSCSSVRRRPRR